MVLLSIKKVIKFESTKVDWSNYTTDIDTISFINNDKANEPEYGSVDVSVHVLEGALKGVKELYIVGEVPELGKLIQFKHVEDENYIVRIKFDVIFQNGFENSVSFFLSESVLVLGLSTKIEGLNLQQQVLDLLVRHVIPTKYDIVMQLASPCLLMLPNDNQDKKNSFFLGKSDNDKAKLNDLIHLVKIHLGDLPSSFKGNNIKNNLSFYLNVNWELDGFNFCVYNYDDHEFGVEAVDFFSFDDQIVLDIPRIDHSLLSEFSYEESYQYEMLYETFYHVIIKDYAFQSYNKFLGYPEPIQNCVAYEAERITNNRDYSKNIVLDAVDWMLLLQVDSDCKWFDFFEELGGGTIYFMIKKEDYMKSDFDKIQVVIQNT